jgi:hypothetical protein
MLGHNGMSDEESGAEEVTTLGGFTYDSPIIKVLSLPWRHPSFRKLYEGVDRVPGVEKSIFKQTGRNNALKRRRVDEESTRLLKPQGLFPSFYRPGYLDSLLPFELAKLKLADGHFPIHDFVLKFND